MRVGRGRARGGENQEGEEGEGEEAAEEEAAEKEEEEQQAMVREGPSVTCISVATRGSGARFSHVARRSHEGGKRGL